MKESDIIPKLKHKPFNMKYIWILILFTLFLGKVFSQRRVNAVVDSLRNESELEILQKKLDALTRSSNEDDWSTAIQYYMAIDQQAKSDSLLLVTVAKFPHGQQALAVAMAYLTHEPKLAVKEKLFAKMQRDFPDMTIRDLDIARNSLALSYAEGKQTLAAIKQLKLVSGRSNIAGVTNYLLQYDAAGAVALLKPELNKLKLMISDTATVANVGNSVIGNSIAGTGNRNMASIKADYYSLQILYSEALSRLGENSEALIYAKEAFELLGYLVRTM